MLKEKRHKIGIRAENLQVGAAQIREAPWERRTTRRRDSRLHRGLFFFHGMVGRPKEYYYPEEKSKERVRHTQTAILGLPSDPIDKTCDLCTV